VLARAAAVDQAGQELVAQVLELVGALLVGELVERVEQRAGRKAKTSLLTRLPFGSSGL
jgi:hypothetical protein